MIMARDMFGDIRQPSITVGSKTRYTVTISVVVHAAVIAAMIITPLVATDVLPSPPMMTVFISTSTPPPPPPPPPPVKTGPTSAEQPHSSLAPLTPPSATTTDPMERERKVEWSGAVKGAVVGIPDGLAGVIGDPPPPPPPPAPLKPVHIGGDVRPPVKMKDVRPVYPAIAQAAR